MKIGFDAKRFMQNNTGLGNYSRNILSILSTYHDENQYILFSPKIGKNQQAQFLLKKNNISSIFPNGFFKIFTALWRSWGINREIKKSRLNFFHGLSNELPIGIKKTKIKSIVSIHDLIFLHYPSYYSPIDRWIYLFKCKYSCQKADKIIAVSECTKRDIISFFQIPEEKIEVIYPSFHPIFKERILEDKKKKIKKKYHLPSLFLLNVSTIEKRKNILLVVKVLRNLPSNIHLVIIGKRTPYQSRIKKDVNKLDLASRVHIFNHIPLKDLPAFYQMASIFVYPSFFEGFGIPILEALVSQVPVISSFGSCLEEAGGKNSLYLHPNKEDEWTAHIQEILNNKDIAKKMVMLGKEHAENFSAQKISKKLIQLYYSIY